MRDLKAEFEAFHADNPHVFTMLADIALDARSRRKTRWGIAALFERLRWISEFETSGDLYKLNNNHRAFYARLLMATYPELDKFFETRFQNHAEDVA
jgi:hypothetical protein